MREKNQTATERSWSLYPAVRHKHNLEVPFGARLQHRWVLFSKQCVTACSESSTCWMKDLLSKLGCSPPLLIMKQET